MNTILEHGQEPSPGIPQALPAGESAVWQGSPGFRRLLVSGLHARKIAIYFVLLLAVHWALASRAGGAGVPSGGSGTLALALLAAVAVGVVVLYAWLAARRAVYTLTTRRIVIRCGVALPVSVNLPLSVIESVGLREFADGTGDLILTLSPGHRASYILLWPHVAMLRVLRVRPALRAVDEVATLAERLAAALVADAGTGEQELPAAGRRPAELPAEPAGPVWARWLGYPTTPLSGAVALVVLSLVSVAAVRFFSDPNPAPNPVQAVESLELRFEDRPDGSVSVSEFASGQQIHSVKPGEEGFVRATMRSLATARTRAGAGMEVPFELVRAADGRLLLNDPVTGRQVDLWAFGETNARSFSQLFSLARGAAGSVSQDPADADVPENVAAIARSNQEATP